MHTIVMLVSVGGGGGGGLDCATDAQNSESSARKEFHGAWGGVGPMLFDLCSPKFESKYLQRNICAKDDTLGSLN